MTNSKEYLARSFSSASNIVQQHYSLPVITRKWNSSGLGKHAEEITVDRWLRPGPDTKNPRFEPWIVGLAAQHL